MHASVDHYLDSDDDDNNGTGLARQLRTNRLTERSRRMVRAARASRTRSGRGPSRRQTHRDASGLRTAPRSRDDTSAGSRRPLQRRRLAYGEADLDGTLSAPVELTDEDEDDDDDDDDAAAAAERRDAEFAAALAAGDTDAAIAAVLAEDDTGVGTHGDIPFEVPRPTTGGIGGGPPTQLNAMLTRALPLRPPPRRSRQDVGFFGVIHAAFQAGAPRGMVGPFDDDRLSEDARAEIRNGVDQFTNQLTALMANIPGGVAPGRLFVDHIGMIPPFRTGGRARREFRLRGGPPSATAAKELMETPSEVCAICLGSFEAKDGAESLWDVACGTGTKKSHVFHKACIQHWHEVQQRSEGGPKRTQCPTCKTIIAE